MPAGAVMKKTFVLVLFTYTEEVLEGKKGQPSTCPYDAVTLSMSVREPNRRVSGIVVIKQENRG